LKEETTTIVALASVGETDPVKLKCFALHAAQAAFRATKAKAHVAELRHVSQLRALILTEAPVTTRVKLSLLAECRAPFLHVEMKVALVGLVCIWSKHRTKGPAGVIMKVFHEFGLLVG
jgi:hypothetical protein